MKEATVKLHRGLIWLSRIHRCRGFGIQSPWAYRFVRYVINEHYPYYGYVDVEKALPGLSARTIKLGQLYLRLANSVQPGLTVSFGPADEAFDMYFRAGCRNTRIVNVDSNGSDSDYHELLAKLGDVDILRLTPQGNYRSFFNAAVMKVREGSVFIIEDIKRNADTRQFWREAVRLLEGVVTFDLYYCGLVCFKPKLFKRNYVVNF